MKTPKQFLRLTLIILVLLTVLILIDFLPLHDIYRDYVSAQFVERFELASAEPLPDWTAAELEWQFVRVNYFLKMLVATAAVLLIGLYLHQGRDGKHGDGVFDGSSDR